MGSINHQFIQQSDNVIKRYKKTIPSIVTGLRLNPNDQTQQITFQLQSPDKNFKITAEPNQPVKVDRLDFDYEEEILELYSDLEVKVFERVNRAFLKAGILVEYTNNAPDVDLSNALTDEQVFEIAAIKQIPALKLRLKSIDSKQTLNRIKSAAEELDRSIGIIKAINTKIDELSE